MGLQRAVRRPQRAPQVVEDACQTAWTILLRRPDVPLDHGLAWLRKVALTTGYKAARQREQPVGGFLPDPDQTSELPDPPSASSNPSSRLADRLDACARLTPLPHRERRFLVEPSGSATPRSRRASQTTARSVERQARKLRQSAA